MCTYTKDTLPRPSRLDLPPRDGISIWWWRTSHRLEMISLEAMSSLFTDRGLRNQGLRGRRRSSVRMNRQWAPGSECTPARCRIDLPRMMRACFSSPLPELSSSTYPSYPTSYATRLPHSFSGSRAFGTTFPWDSVVASFGSLLRWSRLPLIEVNTADFTRDSSAAWHPSGFDSCVYRTCACRGEIARDVEGGSRPWGEWVCVCVCVCKSRRAASNRSTTQQTANDTTVYSKFFCCITRFRTAYFGAVLFRTAALFSPCKSPLMGRGDPLAGQSNQISNPFYRRDAERQNHRHCCVCVSRASERARELTFLSLASSWLACCHSPRSERAALCRAVAPRPLKSPPARRHRVSFCQRHPHVSASNRRAQRRTVGVPSLACGGRHRLQLLDSPTHSDNPPSSHPVARKMPGREREQGWARVDDGGRGATETEILPSPRPNVEKHPARKPTATLLFLKDRNLGSSSPHWLASEALIVVFWLADAGPSNARHGTTDWRAARPAAKGRRPAGNLASPRTSGRWGRRPNSTRASRLDPERRVRRGQVRAHFSRFFSSAGRGPSDPLLALACPTPCRPQHQSHRGPALMMAG